MLNGHLRSLVNLQSKLQQWKLIFSPLNFSFKLKKFFFRFQKKGMDIGVTDDSLNGIPNDLSSSSTEEEEEEEEDENQEGKYIWRI